MKRPGESVSVNEDDERKNLGERLREARKYVGLSQEDVATILKLPRTAMTEIENGQRKVDALELKRMAELYRQSVSHFTGDDAAASLSAGAAHLARQAEALSQRDQEELGRFAEFLRARASTGRGQR